MSNSSSLRILKELKEWQLDEHDDTGIRLEYVGESLSEFCAIIKGPSDTPYCKGKFQLSIKLPPNYPFQPPKIHFLTRIWHPNISSVTGALCLDILNKNRWSPAMTLKTMLLSVQSLLADPKPNDPQDAVVAGQYLQGFDEFRETARYWSQYFAQVAMTKY
uniref:UBC core domain-containing protein n=1 Tax=Romanomermis culicivorax TaxID=13658 RepID=A0A915K134_ROMCU